MILDLSTSDKVAENGLAEFLYVSNWVNLLKSILIFSKSPEASFDRIDILDFLKVIYPHWD
ncbi:MAG: hypothetical protein PHC39_13280 [Proteiniphilum sp.]|nr:hypothetical protein [Proteiniphilum sp.]